MKISALEEECKNSKEFKIGAKNSYACVPLTRVANGNYNSLSQSHPKSSKNSIGSCLDLDISNFI